MTAKMRLGLTAAALALLAMPGDVPGQGPQGAKRATPPTWDKTVLDVFFPDARANLVGDRPTFVGSGRPAPGGTSPPAGSMPAPGASSPELFGWSRLISSDVLLDEIKSYQPLLADDVRTPSVFKGGGYRKACVSFSVLATMFAIVNEYDQDIRLKNQAAAARDLFARAGFNCRVGTDQSFNESKLRTEDLAALLRGESVTPPANLELKNQWGNVAYRPPLMRRLETAHQGRLGAWTANEAEFRSNADRVLHEAEVIAALAEVIQREGFEYWDDDTYREYAQDMQRAALNVAEAAKSNNYEQARTAVGQIAKSCSDCHGGYRN